MIKDMLTITLNINKDTNINPNEKAILLNLILNHNKSYGYAYPMYEDLLVALSTNRRAKVSAVLKSLVAKNYISIEKGRGNKNLYYIHKHLIYVGSHEVKSQVTPQVEPVKVKPKKVESKKVEKKVEKKVVAVDSNGNEPLPNQIHVDEVFSDTVIEISNYTGFNESQSKELLDESNNDKGKVINAFEYVKKKSNVRDRFEYTKWAIKNCSVEVTSNDTKVGFNNFEPRNYNYDELEKRLLGWGTDESVSIYK